MDVDMMETRSSVLGLEHPDTLSSMGNLVSTYSDQGRWMESKDLEVQIIEKKKGYLAMSIQIPQPASQFSH